MTCARNLFEKKICYFFIIIKNSAIHPWRCPKFDRKWPQIWNLTPNQKFFLEIMFRLYWSFWAIVRENWSNLWFLRNKTNLTWKLNLKWAIKPEVGQIFKKWVFKSCVRRRASRVQSFKKFCRKIVQLLEWGLLEQGCNKTLMQELRKLSPKSEILNWN